MYLHTELVTTAAEVTRLVRGVTPEQHSDPTPCSEMDVHALLNHLILWTAYVFELRATGAEVPDEMQTRDYAAEPDYADAYAAQSERAMAAWQDPAVWTEEWANTGGMILMELVLHGWDLAKATGQEFTCGEEIAKITQGIVDGSREMYKEYKGFADEVEIAGSASAFEHALALSGRDPQWRK